jgi:hypothetical protein
MDRATILAALPHLDATAEVPVDAFESAGLSPSDYWADVPFPELGEGQHRVRDSRVDAVRSAVARLTKRAEKLGVPAPVVSTVRVEELPGIVRWFASGRWVWSVTDRIQRFHVLSGTTEPVRLAGWRFVATVEHLGEMGNVLRTAPYVTEDLPQGFRTAAPTCDHCHLSRRRAETFVLRHEDGRWARVGRQCLTDFLGDDSAARLIEAATITLALAGALSDDWGEGGGFGGREIRLDPASVGAATAFFIRKFGWLSRKVADIAFKQSTADAAWELLVPPKGGHRPPFGRKDLDPADFTEAEAALAWAREIPADVSGDYLYNCRVVAHLGSWGHRELGLGASIVAAYQREQDRLRRLEFERKLPSRYVGDVGKRYGSGKGKKAVAPLRCRVLGLHVFDGAYGTTTIVRLQHALGDVAVADCVWFASGQIPTVVLDAPAIAAKADAHNAWEAAKTNTFTAQNAAVAGCEQAEAAAWDALRDASEAAEGAVREIVVGDLVDVTGSVKKHEVSRKTGREQTVLTRCGLTLVPETTDEAK